MMALLICTYCIVRQLPVRWRRKREFGALANEKRKKTIKGQANTVAETRSIHYRRRLGELSRFVKITRDEFRVYNFGFVISFYLQSVTSTMATQTLIWGIHKKKQTVKGQANTAAEDSVDSLSSSTWRIIHIREKHMHLSFRHLRFLPSSGRYRTSIDGNANADLGYSRIKKKKKTVKVYANTATGDNAGGRLARFTTVVD